MLEDVVDDEIIRGLPLLNPIRLRVRTVADAIKITARDGVVRRLHEAHVGHIGIERSYVADPAVVSVNELDSDLCIGARSVVKG